MFSEKEALRLLKEFSEVEGISGHEKNVAKLVKKELEGYADRFEYDSLGCIAAYKDGPKEWPLVMICGHMDEIGFVVKKIEETGHIRITSIGGWYNHVLLAEPFYITTRSGKRIFGVTGAQPPHGLSAEERSKVLPLEKMYIDIGVKDKQMALDLGIKEGDPITPYSEFKVMADNKTLLGKAFDDRAGLCIALQTFKNLAKSDIHCRLAMVGTTQEEVGLRGAKTAAGLVKPDIAFATDVTFSYDIPTQDGYPSKFGSGPALSVLDASIITHTGLFDFVEKVSKEENIPYAYDMLTSGGTDAGSIHLTGSGVIAMTVSLPCRYFHSHYSMIYLDDFMNAVKLMTSVISKIDSKVLNDIKESKYN